jgi:hypothetical protein
MDKILDKKAGQDKQVVYQCPQCNNYPFKTRDGAVKHRQRHGHRVVGIDAETGEVVEEVGKGQPGPKPIAAPPPKKPLISAKGDEHIKEQFKGYSKDGERYLFVMNPDGTIRDFRLEHPLVYPVYELMKKERNYGGDFPQFMADAVETLFANAGFELALRPKSETLIYQQVVRLLEEGKLELVYEGSQLRLGVKDGDKNGCTEGSVPLGGETDGGVELSQQRGKENLGQSE